MKGRKIKNLTREDITIVDYKNLLVKNSACAAHSASSLLLFVFLLRAAHQAVSGLMVSHVDSTPGFVTSFANEDVGVICEVLVNISKG